MAQLLQLVLESDGHDVESETDPWRGRSGAERYGADAVVTEGRAAGALGLPVVRRLVAEQREVVAVVPGHDVDLRRHVTHAGAAAVVRSPIDALVVSRVVLELPGGRPATGRSRHPSAGRPR